jgi:uncharacterized protein
MADQCSSVVDYVLLKLAARCNIACTYCYWFRDATVYEKPKTIARDTLRLLADRILDHVSKFRLPRFSVLFHGGEPLLCNKCDVGEFCRRLRNAQQSGCCFFKFNITTNGLLIDDDWIRIFRENDIGVTISIDGPREVHDSMRIDFDGRGTFDRVVGAIARLRANGIEPGILSVCNPSCDPKDILALLVDELGVKAFDILIPDATHEDAPASIARFYERLFDLWYEGYDSRGVVIRIIDNIVLGLFGGFSESESIGYGPIRRLTVLTNGDMETLDVLRVIRNGFTASNLNIYRNEIQDIDRDPLWREVLYASMNLAPDCEACNFRTACGGGHIASRWSSQSRFDNPSVYCSDIKKIFRHVWARLSPDLRLIPLVELARPSSSSLDHG